MPPKSDLLTAGTTDPWEKKSYEPFPITTKSKMQKTAAKRDNHKKIKPIEAPVEKKPGKPRYMAPPEEAAATLRAKQKVALKGKSWDENKPVTTQAKIRAAEAKKKAMNPLDTDAAFKEAAKAKAKIKAATEKAAKKASRAKEAAEFAEATSVQSNRAIKVKPPGMMSVLHGQDRSSVRFAKLERGKHQAVMFRRTTKANKVMKARRDHILTQPEVASLWADDDVKRVLKSCKENVPKLLGLLMTSHDLHSKFVKLVNVGLLPAPGILDLDAVDLQLEGATFQFMDLPKELRLEVYQLVVVEDRLFIRPDSITGREQPDIAMVSRQVRSEVLPLFYGKNTFAIDLTPESISGRPGFGRSKMRIAEDWVRAIGMPSRVSPVCSLSFIRNWVVDYAAPIFTRSDKADEDHGLMLSMRFSRNTKSRSWSATVEVHRDAACIMHGFEEHGTCIPQMTPDWVNDMVITVCDGAKEEGLTGKAILGLMKALKPSTDALVENRCELAKKFSETGIMVEGR